MHGVINLKLRKCWLLKMEYAPSTYICISRDHVCTFRELFTQYSQYSTWENTKAFLQLGTIVRNAVATLTAFNSLKGGHAQCTSKASAEQVKYVEPQVEHTFLWPLSP